MRNLSIGDEQLSRFFDLVAAIGRRKLLRDPFAQLVEKYRLRPAQLEVLLWLRRDGSLEPHALAQRSGVSQKTIGAVINRVQALGYVRRSPASKTRPLPTVTLTAKGARLARQLEESFAANARLLLDLLEPRDRAALFRILENVVATLDRRYLPVVVTPPLH